MNKIDLIAIGASTGGTEALLNILTKLPEISPSILVVQHMPPGFTGMFANRLDKECKLHVKEACDNESIQKGVCYIAPGGLHLRIVKKNNQYITKVTKEEKISGHAPSVDALFDSVAECYTGNAMGILLTGMGRDGAKGLLKMKQRGFYTIGQDEKSSIVYGMPKAAYEIGALLMQCNTDEMVNQILQCINY